MEATSAEPLIAQYDHSGNHRSNQSRALFSLHVKFGIHKKSSSMLRSFPRHLVIPTILVKVDLNKFARYGNFRTESLRFIDTTVPILRRKIARLLATISIRNMGGATIGSQRSYASCWFLEDKTRECAPMRYV